MPASERSLRITDLYRTRLLALRTHAEQVAQEAWLQVDLADFEASFTNWIGRTTTAVSAAQALAVRTSVAYLGAFLASELGHRVRTPAFDATAYVGRSRDGRPLAEALDSPRIAVLVALKDGADNGTALKAGLDRALRAVDLDVMHAGRQATLDGIAKDDRFEGWRRAVRGTCGACAAAAAETISGELRFEVHPGCGCVTEPSVRGVRDRVARLTGAEIFAAKTKPEQDEMLGPEAAQLVRDGLPLHRLLKHNAMETEPAFITQKPVGALQIERSSRDG